MNKTRGPYKRYIDDPTVSIPRTTLYRNNKKIKASLTDSKDLSINITEEVDIELNSSSFDNGLNINLNDTESSIVFEENSNIEE